MSKQITANVKFTGREKKGVVLTISFESISAGARPHGGVWIIKGDNWDSKEKLDKRIAEMQKLRKTESFKLEGIAHRNGFFKVSGSDLLIRDWADFRGIYVEGFWGAHGAIKTKGKAGITPGFLAGVHGKDIEWEIA